MGAWVLAFRGWRAWAGACSRAYAWLALVAVALLGSAGCAVRVPPAGGVSDGKVDSASVAREGDEGWGPSDLKLAVPAGMESLVSGVLDTDPEGRRELDRVMGIVRGREFEFFEVFLGRAAHEARDVSRWLDAAAFGVGRIGPPERRLAVVREVSARECCMRGGFLAASLRGLARGMVESGEPPRVQAEAVLRLQQLTSHSDPDVCAAALVAQRQFRLPPVERR